MTFLDMFDASTHQLNQSFGLIQDGLDLEQVIGGIVFLPAIGRDSFTVQSESEERRYGTVEWERGIGKRTLEVPFKAKDDAAIDRLLMVCYKETESTFTFKDDPLWTWRGYLSQVEVDKKLKGKLTLSLSYPFKMKDRKRYVYPFNLPLGVSLEVETYIIKGTAPSFNGKQLDVNPTSSEVRIKPLDGEIYVNGKLQLNYLKQDSLWPPYRLDAFTEIATNGGSLQVIGREVAL